MAMGLLFTALVVTENVIAEANGIRIRSVVLEGSVGNFALVAPDSPEDLRVPDQRDVPHFADPTWTGADVVGAEMETARQTTKGAQEAERRCNREREGAA
jgi:hypothetical protein